jgi:type IV pilus assembly protein PilW
MTKLIKSKPTTVQLTRQTGYTLVEFMIAGSLGLLLLLGVTQVYLSASQTNRLQSGVIEVQDMGRFVLSYLEKDLQRAGWSNMDPIDLGTLDTHIDFTGTTNGTGTNSSDSITIQYEADDEAGVDTQYDCGGTAVANGDVITNVYTVAGGVLSCNGRALIDNVETLQLIYGVESLVFDRDNMVDGYLRADQIAGTGYEETVISVRIGVLLRSTNEVLDTANTNSFQVLDYNHPAQNDRRIRRVFVKTVLLPNRPKAI